MEQSYILVVERLQRIRTNQNHTATHLLHRALKQILGDHANQAGSYVGPDRLRFDFSHFGKVTDEELKQIEAFVNNRIEHAVDVNIAEMSIEEAKATGAMALFGEKYGERVRVVNIANESIELCGGTHVANTSEIGTFKLVSESGIGAGIRRIEALTGQAAIADYQAEASLLREVQAQLKVAQASQLLNRIEQLHAELKDSQSQIESLTAKIIRQEANSSLNNVKQLGDITYVVSNLGHQTVDAMRQMSDIWREKGTSNILVLVTSQEDKVNVMVAVDDATVAKGLKAGNIIKPLAQLVGGGGGGKPQMAQAGGKNPAGIPALLEAVPSVISEQLV